MDPGRRIEQALSAAVAGATERTGCPPRLAAAMHYAVFPGGARVRSRLCHAVAAACGDDRPELTDAAAAAIELLHCASLVHDDLPCFDDAATRRGKPSLHRAFDERIAILVGDALIVLAFQSVAAAGAATPQRLATLLQTVARGVGASQGIVGGQAWECEPRVPLAQYQRAKTGALFSAATMAGAEAAGAEPGPWRMLGERLGEAYQVADDILDAAADADAIGKPVGRDVALDRPSAVRELGIGNAIHRFDMLMDGAIDSIPSCPGASYLRALILMEAQRLVPKEFALRAA